MGQLTGADIEKLRASGKILEGETVLMEGDLVIAVNATTGERRVVDTGGVILEAKKQLLLD